MRTIKIMVAATLVVAYAIELLIAIFTKWRD